MSDFTEARDEVITLLAEYGEPVVVTREAKSYDPASQTTTTLSTLIQTLQGRLDPARAGNARMAASETPTFERTALLSPDGMLFEPAVGDILTAEGRDWRIGDNGLKITRGGGVVIIIEAGLLAA